MPRRFDDPVEELEFIGSIEEEIDRLEMAGVVDRETSRRVHAHYDAKRELLLAEVRQDPDIEAP